MSELLQSQSQAAYEAQAVGGEKEFSIQGLEFVCESEGFRYYRDPTTGRQCCLDSAGYWFLFNEAQGAFEPVASAAPAKQTSSSIEKQRSNKQADKVNNALKNVERYGIRFDQHGKPIFPKNDKGLYVLPKDEKGAPFFPIDDQGTPIFPWDHEKGEPTFPFDETDEPIFPRNDQNKPIVPKDSNDQPIFPVDKTGSFIFPFDESNCPIPALTIDGASVVPKDEFGNSVVPRDRDGKPLIHVAADGVTAISMAEWRQWKKYYKEQARNFYQHQQQSQQQQVAVVDPSVAGAAAYPMNSMFHPLNLAQQSAYFAADMEMLQRVRRVRPEDVDLPGQMENQASNDPNQSAKGPNAEEDKQEKRKKFLQAQLKSAKKLVPPPALEKKNSIEEPKKNGIVQAEKMNKSNEKAKIKEKVSKLVEENAKKRAREESRERNAKTDRNLSDRARARTRSPEPKRRRRSRSSSYSPSRSRSRSYESRGRNSGRKYQSRRRSPSYSSRSRSSSYSSYSYSSYSRSSDGRSRSRSASYTTERDEEEERIRDRIIARTLPANAAIAEPVTDSAIGDEAMEYGPKPPPPPTTQSSTHNSDMEMSDEEQQQQQQVAPPTAAKMNVKEEALSTDAMNEKQAPPKVASPPKDDAPSSTVPTVANAKTTMVVVRQGSLNVKEVLASGDLELIKLCKEQELEKYDQLKLQIAELEVEKSVHKRNWTQLREAEKRVIGHRNARTLSISDDEAN